MTPRLWLIVVGLWAGAAAAQGEMDPCNQVCADKMMGCMQKCQGDMKCTGRCQNQMQACMTRCNAQPAAVSPADKKKKCYGADGNKVPCQTYKQTKAPKNLPEDEKAEFPNKSAKDLAQDPEFKGAVPTE